MLTRKLFSFTRNQSRSFFFKKKKQCECEKELDDCIKGVTSSDVPDIEVPYMRPVRFEAPKVRLGFLPDNWFTMLYDKTGVTGPYVLGAGILTYLFSKEIYVCDHEFYGGLSLLIAIIYVVKKLGPKLANYCDKEVDKIETAWKNEKKVLTDMLNKDIEMEKMSQFAAEGGLLMLDAKKENVQLQLEAEYRRRFNHAYKEVKHRLDYLMACKYAEDRIKHKHKINWVINEVISSITPEQKKEEIDKCFADLSAMATRMKDVK